MSSIETREQGSRPQPRRRMSREERQRQLLDVAWRLVREEGTEALTLGRLAEQAGVTKPVVYDHFSTRPGLLAALYQPVWQSAVLAPADLALAAVAFYLLRVIRLPILALAALLVGANLLLI